MQRQNDDPLSGPIRKKSKPSEDSTDEPDHETKTERQRVRFKGVDDSETETSTCPACKQIIVKETEEYDSLMEKSVTMVTFFIIRVVWKCGRMLNLSLFSGLSVLSQLPRFQASASCRNPFTWPWELSVRTWDKPYRNQAKCRSLDVKTEKLWEVIESKRRTAKNKCNLNTVRSINMTIIVSWKNLIVKALQRCYRDLRIENWVDFLPADLNQCSTWCLFISRLERRPGSHGDESQLKSTKQKTKTWILSIWKRHRWTVSNISKSRYCFIRIWHQTFSVKWFCLLLFWGTLLLNY